MSVIRKHWLCLSAGLALAGCTKVDTDFDGGVTSDATFSEAGWLCTDPEGDEDGDGILNGDEGCVAGRDTDRDKTPDWQDFDSDNDGIFDATEKGEQGKCKGPKPATWPCDTDGDGTPDYLDVDSDNDAVLDKDEDPSGDGIVGCCLTVCGKPDARWQQKNCILNKEGCGPGQACQSGKCTPPVDFQCSKGETSPLAKDTFGDGKLDKERGSFICRDATEDNLRGRKVVQVRKSAANLGDWNVAMEKTAKYGELAITDPAAKQAAAVIDEEGTNAEVAGFVISKDPAKANVQEELSEILAALSSRTPGGKGDVTVRASGIAVKSHDRYDSVQGTILDLSLTTSTNISNVRNELIGTLLGKPMAELGNLPAPFGAGSTEFVLRLVTVKRFEFKKDSGKVVLDDKGYPVDTGDKSKWRLLVMGAVAAKTTYQDPSRVTGFMVDDLSNGTALATANDTFSDECDVGSITSLPVADIIWVVDESGSMDDNREDIVNNAKTFFSRALAAGLDFRMGVTGVNDPSGTYASAVGKFCSKISTDTSDDGGQDRFLTPQELSIFESCVNNPPGYEMGSEYGLTNSMEAVKKHLDRAAGAPDKIRPEAKLVIIMVTDEIPQELGNSILDYSDYETCQLDSSKQAAVNNYIKPQLDLLSGITNPDAAAMYHLIGGVCNNSCTADVAHGYRELAQALGGQIGDVCQKDLGNTLQVIIDSIVGAASPVKLEYVPISASLAVALDGVEVLRSRTNGFDYRSSSNTLAFINVKYRKGSEVVASYHRWERQTDPDRP